MPISTAWSENFLTKLDTFIPLTIKIIFYHEYLLSNKRVSYLTTFPVQLSPKQWFWNQQTKYQRDQWFEQFACYYTESKMSEIKGIN